MASKQPTASLINFKFLTKIKMTNSSEKGSAQSKFTPVLDEVKMATANPSGIGKFSDENLFQLCKRFGKNALHWRQKFIGLLPEVNRRRLYEKKGFSSIFEFSFKLCGLSADQVNLTLNLSRRFEDKLVLKGMLENGEVSINKLARIVSIATVENQEELAEKIRILPKSALETLVRDEKFAMNNLQNNDTNSEGLFGTENYAKDFQTENRNGLSKPLFEDKSLPGQTDFPAKRSVSFDSDRCVVTSVLSFKLTEDVKKELEKLNSKGIDVNEFLRKALKQRKEEIENKKEEIAKEIERNDVREQPSRYVSAEIKQILKEEHGTKCSIPNCTKPATILHHTQKFSLSHCHDPRFLAPLCEEHHVIAHSMDVKYCEMKNSFR